MKHISYSQLNTFLSCPLKWKNAQEARERGEDGYGEATWNMKVGTVVHTVMEMMHHPDYIRLGEALDVAAFFEAALVDQPLVNADAAKPLFYQNEAWRCILAFLTEFGAKDENWNPTHVEYEFDVPLTPTFTLQGVFDDITLDHENKEIVIGEYKTSLKDMWADSYTMMTTQPYVYQYACGQLWPNYTLVSIDYTLITPRSAQRISRPMWPGDRRPWEEYLVTQAQGMAHVLSGYIPAYPNYSSFNCGRCQFWDTCKQNILIGS